MATKLFLLQFLSFGYDFVGLAQKDFHHSSAMAQIFLLALLVSLKRQKFRYEIVL